MDAELAELARGLSGCFEERLIAGLRTLCFIQVRSSKVTPMAKMIPVGYLAKRVALKPDFLNAPQVVDIFSASGCISGDFADYIGYWKHNGYWLFDSPEIIKTIAEENAISLDGTSLFYYEAYESELDGRSWSSVTAEPSLETHVSPPPQKRLEGFDVVTFFARNAPECSPLSCNSLAEKVPTNRHCLLQSFEEAERFLNEGVFEGGEPGPYRIFAVYSVHWR